jgi:uncharacterized protein (DUF2225 family)
VNGGQELCRPPALRHDWTLGLRYDGANTLIYHQIVCRNCSASYASYRGYFTAEEEEEEWRRIVAGSSPRYPVWSRTYS